MPNVYSGPGSTQTPILGSRQILTIPPLQGGGDLSADRTLIVDPRLRWEPISGTLTASGSFAVLKGFTVSGESRHYAPIYMGANRTRDRLVTSGEMAGGGGGPTAPGGGDQAVQFNTGGSFDGVPAFTFDKVTNQLLVFGNILTLQILTGALQVSGMTVLYGPMYQGGNRYLTSGEFATVSVPGLPEESVQTRQGGGFVGDARLTWRQAGTLTVSGTLVVKEGLTASGPMRVYNTLTAGNRDWVRGTGSSNDDFVFGTGLQQVELGAIASDAVSVIGSVGVAGDIATTRLRVGGVAAGGMQTSGIVIAYRPIYSREASDPRNRYVTSGDLAGVAPTGGTPVPPFNTLQYNAAGAWGASSVYYYPTGALVPLLAVSGVNLAVGFPNPGVYIGQDPTAGGIAIAAANYLGFTPNPGGVFSSFGPDLILTRVGPSALKISDFGANNPTTVVAGDITTSGSGWVTQQLTVGGETRLPGVPLSNKAWAYQRFSGSGQVGADFFHLRGQGTFEGAHLFDSHQSSTAEFVSSTIPWVVSPVAGNPIPALLATVTGATPAIKATSSTGTALTASGQAILLQANPITIRGRMVQGADVAINRYVTSGELAGVGTGRPGGDSGSVQFNASGLFFTGATGDGVYLQQDGRRLVVSGTASFNVTDTDGTTYFKTGGAIGKFVALGGSTTLGWTIADNAETVLADVTLDRPTTGTLRLRTGITPGTFNVGQVIALRALLVSGTTLLYGPAYQGVASTGTRYITSGEMAAGTTTNPGGSAGTVQINASGAFTGVPGFTALWQRDAVAVSISGGGYVDVYGYTPQAAVRIGPQATLAPSPVGMAAWYKGEALAPLADNQPIPTWPDSSPNARHATVSGSVRYYSAIVNGRPVARFIGSGYFNLPDMGFGGGEIFLVLRRQQDPPPVGHVELAGFYNFQPAGPNPTHVPFTDTFIYEGFGAATRYDGVPRPPFNMASKWWLYNVYSDTNNWAARADTATLQSSTTNTAAWPAAGHTRFGGTLFSRGDNPAGIDYFLQADVAEVILYSGVISGAARAQTEQYLGQKYALSFASTANTSTTTSGLTAAVLLASGQRLAWTQMPTADAPGAVGLGQVGMGLGVLDATGAPVGDLQAGDVTVSGGTQGVLTYSPIFNTRWGSGASRYVTSGELAGIPITRPGGASGAVQFNASGLYFGGSAGPDGIFYDGSASLPRLVVSGVSEFRVTDDLGTTWFKLRGDNQAVQFGSATTLSWGSAANRDTGGTDLRLVRHSAATLRIAGAVNPTLGDLVVGNVTASGQGHTLYGPAYQGVAIAANRYITSGEMAAGTATNPGAPPGSVQYNSGGTFAGDPQFTWEPLGNTLLVSGGTIRTTVLEFDAAAFQSFAGRLLNDVFDTNTFAIRGRTIASGIVIGQESTDQQTTTNLRNLWLRANATTITGRIQASGEVLAYGPIWAGRQNVAGNRYVTSGELVAGTAASPGGASGAVQFNASGLYFGGSSGPDGIFYDGSASVPRLVVSGVSEFRVTDDLGTTWFKLRGDNQAVQFGSATTLSWGSAANRDTGATDLRLVRHSVATLRVAGAVNPTLGDLVVGNVTASGQAHMLYGPVYQGLASTGTRYVTSGELKASSGSPGGSAGSVQINASGAFTGVDGLTALWQRQGVVVSISGGGYLDLYATTTAGVRITGGDQAPFPNMAAWYKADTIPASGTQAIPSWPDSSGYGRTATVSGLVTYYPGVVNNRPVARFTGSGLFTLPDFMSGFGGAEIFVVLRKPVDPSPTVALAGLWNFAPAATNPSYFPFTDTFIYEGFGTTARKDTIAHPALTTWSLYNVRSAPSDYAVRLNTGPLFSTATNTVSWPAAGKTHFGGVFGSENPSFATNLLQADVAEVLIYSGVLTAAARAQTEQYLGQKYALPYYVGGTAAIMLASGQRIGWTPLASVDVPAAVSLAPVGTGLGILDATGAPVGDFQAGDVTISGGTQGVLSYTPIFNTRWGTAASRYVTSGELAGIAGASPAGPTTAIQYNNAGIFGGSSGFTYDPSTNIAQLFGYFSTLQILTAALQVSGQTVLYGPMYQGGSRYLTSGELTAAGGAPGGALGAVQYNAGGGTFGGTSGDGVYLLNAGTRLVVSGTASLNITDADGTTYFKTGGAIGKFVAIGGSTTLGWTVANNAETVLADVTLDRSPGAPSNAGVLRLRRGVSPGYLQLGDLLSLTQIVSSGVTRTAGVVIGDTPYRSLSPIAGTLEVWAPAGAVARQYGQIGSLGVTLGSGAYVQWLFGQYIDNAAFDQGHAFLALRGQHELVVEDGNNEPGNLRAGVLTASGSSLAGLRAGILTYGPIYNRRWGAALDRYVTSGELAGVSAGPGSPGGSAGMVQINASGAFTGVGTFTALWQRDAIAVSVSGGGYVDVYSGGATGVRIAPPVGPPALGMAAWYKADAIPASGTQAITVWPDSSGYGRNATASGVVTYYPGVVNGRPVARFIGSGLVNLPDFMSGFGGANIFIVIKKFQDPSPNATAAGLWNFGPSSIGTSHYDWNADSKIYEAFGAATRFDAIVTGASLAQWRLYHVSSAPNSWANRLDTAILSSTITNTVSWPAQGHTRLGASIGTSPAPPNNDNSFNSDHYLQADVAEVLIYSGIMSTTDRTRVEQYLGQKYALSYPWQGAPLSGPLNAAVMLASGQRIGWTQQPTADAPGAIGLGQVGTGLGVLDQTGSAIGDFQAGDLTISGGGILTYGPIYNSAWGTGASRYVTSGELSATGGASPAGPDQSIQFRNASAFAGFDQLVRTTNLSAPLSLVASGYTILPKAVAVGANPYRGAQFDTPSFALFDANPAAPTIPLMRYAVQGGGGTIPGMFLSSGYRIHFLAADLANNIGNATAGDVALRQLAPAELAVTDYNSNPGPVTLRTGTFVASGWPTGIITYSRLDVRDTTQHLRTGPVLVSDENWTIGSVSEAGLRTTTILRMAGDPTVPITISGSFPIFAGLSLQGPVTYWGTAGVGLTATVFNHNATWTPGNASALPPLSLLPFADQPTLIASGTAQQEHASLFVNPTLVVRPGGRFIMPGHSGVRALLVLSGVELTTRAGLRMVDATGYGTLNVQRGLHVDALAKGNLNWAIGSDGLATPSYHAGSLFLGTSGQLPPFTPPQLLILNVSGLARPALEIRTPADNAADSPTRLIVQQVRVTTLTNAGQSVIRVPTASGSMYFFEARIMMRNPSAGNTQNVTAMMYSTWLGRGVTGPFQLGSTTTPVWQSIGAATAMFSPSGLSQTDPGICLIVSGSGSATNNWHVTLTTMVTSG